MGTVAFMERFRRLYDLSIHQNLMVVEMHALGWGEDGEAWRWRRRLLAWEEELVVEIRNLISNTLHCRNLFPMLGFHDRM